MKFDFRTCLLTILGIALAATAWFGWKHRHDLAMLRHAQALAAEAKSEAPACEAFQKKWNAIDTFTPAGNNALVHKNKEQALAMLNVFETYPGWLPKDAALADYFADHETSVSKNMFFLPLLALQVSVRGECDLLGFFHQSQILLNDIPAFHLGPAESARINAVVLKFLVSEPSFRYLLEGAVKNTVLENYLKSRNAPAALIARVHQLSDEFEAYSTKAAALSKNDGRWERLLGTHRRAMDSVYAREFYRKYHALLVDAFLFPSATALPKGKPARAD